MDKFIKVHPFIYSAIKPNEVALIVALCQQEYVLQYRDDKTGWSKNHLMTMTGLSKRDFDRVTKSMVQKRLLIFKMRETGGGRNQYFINWEEYEKLLFILGCTNNVDELSLFFKKFWDDGRYPTDFNESDHEFLSSTIISWEIKTKNGDFVARKRVQRCTRS